MFANSRKTKLYRIGLATLGGVLLTLPPGTALSLDAPITSVLPWDDLEGVFLAPSSSDPAPASIAQVSVRTANNVPVPNAVVELTFVGATTVCGDAVLSSVTNEEGIAQLRAVGGGCANAGTTRAVIKVDGVPIRVYGSYRSPDFDGGGSDGLVTLGDLIEFALGFGTGGGNCHDYNHDGVVGLSDLTLFGPAFVAGAACR